MLPRVGSILSPWLPTRLETKTVTSTFYGAKGPETSTVTRQMPESTLSSMKPGFWRGHSPVTGGNDVEDASRGHAEWLGNKLQFSGNGRQNYYYIPAVENRVSFCVILPDTLAIGGYVVSDSYGGCEYHVATNSATMELALLHVFRGSSGLTKYKLGSNWRLKTTHRSNDLVEKIPRKADNEGQRDGSVLSISYIPPCRLWKDFSIESGFICVNGAGLVTHTLFT